METLVLLGYDYMSNMAAYLPIQNMHPVQTEELHQDLQKLAFEGRATRVEGFGTMRALSHSLSSVGLPLEVFLTPSDLHLGPLLPEEERVEEDDGFYILNKKTGAKQRQVPLGMDWGKLGMLISISDQGPLNCPCLDMMQWKMHMLILPLYDPFHRCWNDIKTALKSCAGRLFRVMLMYALFFNVSYGPSGSKAWFERKRQAAREFLLKHSATSDIFLSYVPHICRELLMDEPSTQEELQGLYDRICTMDNLRILGPLTKLMRWFSLFECDRFYSGEIWLTKMVMSAGGAPEEGLKQDAVACPSIVNLGWEYAVAPFNQGSLVTLVCRCPEDP